MWNGHEKAPDNDVDRGWGGVGWSEAVAGLVGTLAAVLDLLALVVDVVEPHHQQAHQRQEQCPHAPGGVGLEDEGVEEAKGRTEASEGGHDVGNDVVDVHGLDSENWPQLGRVGMLLTTLANGHWYPRQ